MNKTALLLCGGLIFVLGAGSQAYSQAATEYGLLGAASHGAAIGSIHHPNATAAMHRSLASPAKTRKSSGRTAEARVVHRGPTQQGSVTKAAPPAEHSQGLQMSIVGAAPEYH